MDPSCLSFLRCFLCCQDEIDDSINVDVGLSGAGRSIRNLFQKTSSRSRSGYDIVASDDTTLPRHTRQVRESNVHASVPQNNNTVNHRPSPLQRPLQNNNAARNNFEAELLFALLHGSRPQQLSSPPRPSQSTSSSKTPQPSFVSSSSATPKPAKPSFVSSSSATPKPANSSSKTPQPSFVSSSSITPKPANSSSKTPQPSFVSSSSATPKPANSSSKTPQPSFVSSSSATPKPANSSSKTPQPSFVSSSSITPKPANSSSRFKSPESLIDSLSSSRSNSSSQKQPPILKPTLTKVTHQQGKANYLLAENDSLPLYIIPDDIKDLIKRDIVPDVVKKPVSPFTYKDYFSVLLYAEDYYYEKWSEYKLLNVTLELHEARVYKKSDRRKGFDKNEDKDDTIFVAFKLDTIHQRRPFLLSRDLAYARPSGSEVEPFQGIIHRVVKSNLVLVKFKDDFHSQHYPSRRYDISFSFNRVSLKRAHQALSSVSDSLFENFLFPSCVSRNGSTPTPVLTSSTCRLDAEISSTIRQISGVKGSPSYLIAGPRCTSEAKTAAHLREPSRTGVLIQETVILTYKTSPHCRILICSPSNSTCDVLMRGLKKVIPESHMFRANAAFREKEDVPADILLSSLYKEECFICPPLQTLRQFNVIFSTFMSCFRLHNEGLPVGHFSHIFMVDATFAIEPEAMVPLSNFADKNTVVVVTGEVGSSPSWVRSEIGRKNGLKTSYFERLGKCRPYHSLSPSFITQLDLNQDACFL